MNHPEYILLPVSPLFIALSLLIAFVLNLLPWGDWLWAPDFVALTLIFWSIYEPRRIGIGVSFAMGLLMDVHDAALLGEHALSYTLLSYFAMMMHRRVVWFPLKMQALHIFPLLLLMQIVQLLVQLIVTGKFPGWLYFSGSVVTAVLWPLTTSLLLAPQHRSINTDDTRPI